MRKLAILGIILAIASVGWIATPFFYSFGTGNVFYEVGANSFDVAKIWVGFGILALIVKVVNRRKNKQVKQLA